MLVGPWQKHIKVDILYASHFFFGIRPYLRIWKAIISVPIF